MKPSNATMVVIRQRAKEGQSSRQIAEHTGVPARTVLRIVQANGWGAVTVIGKDGRKRKGRRTVPTLHPAPGECGICDDPACDGHTEELDQPNTFIPCWACQRTGAVRDCRGRRVLPCAVCRACGWLAVEADDRYPSNQYDWVEADWYVLRQAGLVGRTTVPRGSMVRRDWRS